MLDLFRELGSFAGFFILGMTVSIGVWWLGIGKGVVYVMNRVLGEVR